MCYSGAVFYSDLMLFWNTIANINRDRKIRGACFLRIPVGNEPFGFQSRDIYEESSENFRRFETLVCKQAKKTLHTFPGCIRTECLRYWPNDAVIIQRRTTDWQYFSKRILVRINRQQIQIRWETAIGGFMLSMDVQCPFSDSFVSTRLKSMCNTPVGNISCNQLF